MEVWLQRTIHSLNLDMTDTEDADTVLLSNPFSMSCRRYAKMTAYGNHWRVDDEYGRSCKTFDCGVACLEANEQSSGTGKNYVGILQDIFVLNYGAVKTPVIIFSCMWKRRYDNFRHETYVRDADGFLVVNFKHNTSRSVDPYVFPSQCSQVFFSDDDLRPEGTEWKVILRKEARSRRKVEEDDDVFINSAVMSAGAVPSSTFANPPTEPDLTGAIVLNETDNAIALQSFERVELRNSGRRIPRETGSTQRPNARRNGRTNV